PVLRRRWRCPEPGCPAFGAAEGAQPPAHLTGGASPACPRHEQPLTDQGPAADAVPTLVILEGAARHRFVVRSDRPVPVGRNPESPGVRLGLLLDDEAARLVSRSHLMLELSGGRLAVIDTSTNGTVVLARSGPDAAPTRVELTRGERYELGDWDSVELHTGVELVSARHWRGGGAVEPSSMLADAPTMAMRIPRPV
ncbi:MAG: FHA domain-containing protein, partial [Micromonosporaceae bacterium]